MDRFPLISRFIQAWRRRRLAQVLDDLQAWEHQGRDILAQVLELTDPDDDLHAVAVRLLMALED